MYVINCNLQRMLEKAEQRSRALGITNASKFPLSECSISATADAPSAAAAAATAGVSINKPTPLQTPTPTSISSSNISNAGAGKIVILEKATLEASPTKPLRHYAAVNKENMEMGIEINITTAQPIGVSSFHTHVHSPFVFALSLVVFFCICLWHCLCRCLCLCHRLLLCVCFATCVRVFIFRALSLPLGAS